MIASIRPRRPEKMLGFIALGDNAGMRLYIDSLTLVALPLVVLTGCSGSPAMETTPRPATAAHPDQAAIAKAQADSAR
jgi:hypothetical protein